MPPPSTIRAWQYSSTKGGLEKNLTLNPAANLPTTNSTQHLVQVLATALNPVDYKPAEIPLVSRLILRKPATPCIDYAGYVVTPAEGSDLKPGEQVFGVAGTTVVAGGALAEFAVAGKAGTVALPEGVDLVDAATAGVAGLTAYQSIVPRVKKGDSVFINAGSGGTGVFGIQIAKAVGCYVATSCSTPNVALCKRLGADEVVDYKTQSVVETLKAGERKFDLVVDNVGMDTSLYWRCHEYTNPGATFVMVGGKPSLGFVLTTLKMKWWPGVLGGGKRKYSGFFAEPVSDDMAQIGKWMQEGKVKAVIDQRFPFEQAPKAFEKLKTGRAVGKIVVDVTSEKWKARPE